MVLYVSEYIYTHELSLPSPYSPSPPLLPPSPLPLLPPSPLSLLPPSPLEFCHTFHSIYLSHLPFVGAEGDRLKESGAINSSLLTLGTVIGKILDGSTHVPFRDSKLTRILQASFGGNARTAVICAVTSAPQHADETVSTMSFANKVKNIKNHSVVNEVLDDSTLLKRFVFVFVFFCVCAFLP